MSKKEPSGRLARWALKIQEYDITIGYRPGKTNQNADSLSRIPILPAAANITFVKQDNWVESQQGDEYCRSIMGNLGKKENDFYIMPKLEFLQASRTKIKSE